MNEPTKIANVTNAMPDKKMKLRIFSSFEEAAEAEAADNARQAPLDRIKETVELILRVYGVTREELMNRKKNLKINIISHK